MKQYEVFWAWILVSKKHFQFIHLVEEISILLPFSYCCKYIILWIPQAALSTNYWSMLLSVWEKGVSSCTDVLGECMFSIYFSKYLDMGFLGQMQSFALLYRKLLNCFICIHAHNVGVLLHYPPVWTSAFIFSYVGMVLPGIIMFPSDCWHRASFQILYLCLQRFCFWWLSFNCPFCISLPDQESYETHPLAQPGYASVPLSNMQVYQCMHTSRWRF